MIALRLIGRFVLNCSILSFLLATFVIKIEKGQGWGSGFGPFWGKHYFETGRWAFIAKWSEKYYFTLFHLMVFGIVIPMILLYEYWVAREMPLFYIATWLEMLVVVDLMWFFFNWYFPGKWYYRDSLRELFKGSDGKIWWHTKYWRFGTIQLPRFYFWTSLFATLLLAVQYKMIQ